MTGMSLKAALGMSVSVLTLAAAAGIARAQEAAASVPPVVDELIVTASRRAEALQMVPLSISAVTDATIRERGISDYDSLTRTVPGVITTGGAGFSKMTVRGIETSQTTSSIGAQRAVSIFLDDLPLTTFAVVTPDIAPYDLSRIEVLRGPQGTLFGAGSLAGAVRYITARPDPSAYDASLDVEAGVAERGSWRRRASAMANIPLPADGLGVRLVGVFRDEDGYIDNIGTGERNANSQKDHGVRAALGWTPNGPFAATLTAAYNRTVLGDASFYDPALGLRRSRSAEPFRVTSELKTLNLSMSYDLGWAEVTSSSTLAKAPFDWNLELSAVLPGVPLSLREVVDTTTYVQEVRLVSAQHERFDWVSGLYYLRQSTDQQDILYLATPFVQALSITGLPTDQAPGSAFSNDIEEKENRELAAFGELNWRLTPGLKLTAGLRVSDTKFTTIITGEGYTAPAFYAALFSGGNQALALVPQQAGSYSTGHAVRAAPKVSLTWRPGPDQTLYVTAAQGFRRGQPNGVAALNGGRSLINPADPALIPLSAAGDTLWNFELGAKSVWLDGRLRTNLAAFLIRWSDMQIPLVRSSDQSPYVGNIGSARSLGLEGEIEARPTASLQLGLNFTFQEAKVTDITPEQALISGAVDGSPLASPKVKLGGHIRYEWDLGSAGQAYARLDVQHVGAYANGFPNTPGAGVASPTYAKIPSYEKLDVSLAWSRDRLGVVVYVENLLDNDGPVFINPANFSFNRYATLRPRTGGVRVSWKY